MRYLLFVLVAFCLVSVVAAAPMSIVGDSAVANDAWVYINVTPATTTRYAVVDIMPKQYTGSVTLVIGTKEDGSVMRPIGIEYHNPRMVQVNTSYTCDGVFNYTLNPKHFWCFTQGNASNSSIPELVFEHDFDGGNVGAKTAWWYVNESREWSRMPWNGQVLEYSFGGNDKYYFLQGYNLTSNTKYRVRVEFEAPRLRIGEKPRTMKYDMGFYPSSYGTDIAAANQAGHLYYIDPWVVGNNGVVMAFKMNESSGNLVDSVNTSVQWSAAATPYYQNASYVTAFNGSVDMRNNGYFQGLTTATPIKAINSTFTVNLWAYYQAYSSGLFKYIWEADHGQPYWGMSMTGNADRLSMFMPNGTTSVMVGTGVTPTVGKWTMFTLVKNGSKGYAYMDARNIYNFTNLNLDSGLNVKSTMCLGYSCYSDANNHWLDRIDEFTIWDRALSIEEIIMLNGTAADPLQYPFPAGAIFTNISVVFRNQTPSDITTTNLIGTSQTLNISYNITAGTFNISNTSMLLFYRTNRSDGTVPFYANGSYIYNTFINATPNNKCGNNTNFCIANWSVDDEGIYPGVYQYPQSITEVTPHSAFTITGANSYVKIRLYNISNTSIYSFFEIMANTTTGTGGAATTYYCNDSYTTGSPQTDVNCVSFGTILSNQSYNHAESAYSSHHYVPYVVNVTSGKIGNVQVTRDSSFLLRGGTGATWNVWYINVTTRTDTTQSTTNNGATWTNQAFTIDSHVHAYDGTSVFNYYACAKDTNGTESCSSPRMDTLNLSILPPGSPHITNPVGGEVIVDTPLMLNWTPSALPNNNTNITGYALMLYTESGSFVKNISIVSGVDLNYSWNWSGTSTRTSYEIAMYATDNYNQTSALEFSEAFQFNTRPLVTFINVTPAKIYADTPAVWGICNGSDADADTRRFETWYNLEGVPYQGNTGLANYGDMRAVALVSSLVRGQNWTFTCVINDSTHLSSNQMNYTFNVSNSPPVIPALGFPTVSPAPIYAKNTTLLTCTNGSVSDADGDNVTFYYNWFVNSIDTNQSTDTLNSSFFVIDDIVVCRVTPYDGIENGTYKNSVNYLVIGSYDWNVTGSTSVYETMNASWKATLELIENETIAAVSFFFVYDGVSTQVTPTIAGQLYTALYSKNYSWDNASNLGNATHSWYWTFNGSYGTGENFTTTSVAQSIVVNRSFSMTSYSFDTSSWYESDSPNITFRLTRYNSLVDTVTPEVYLNYTGSLIQLPFYAASTHTTCGGVNCNVLVYDGKVITPLIGNISESKSLVPLFRFYSGGMTYTRGGDGYNYTGSPAQLSTAQNGTAYQMILGNCSDAGYANVTVANYTLRDEDSYVSLVGNTTLNTVAWVTTRTLTRSASLSYPVRSNFSLCSKFSLPFTNDFIARYTADGYSPREQAIVGHVVGGVVENYTLLLTNLSGASYVLSHVVDEIDSGYQSRMDEPVTTEAYLYRADTNTYTLVESRYTDVAGKSMFTLDLSNNNKYKFVVKFNGTQVLDTGVFEPTSPYEFWLRIPRYGMSYLTMAEMASRTASLVSLNYSSSANTLYGRWSGVNATSTQVCFAVYNISSLGKSSPYTTVFGVTTTNRVYRDCSSANAGTALYNFGSLTGEYLGVFEAYFIGATDPVVVESLSVKPRDSSRNAIGATGYFVAFLIVGTLGFASLMVSGLAAIWVTVIGLLGIALMPLGLFNVYSLIGVVLVALILSLVMKR